MNKFKLIFIFTLSLCLQQLSAQKVTADIISNDANEHYLTIDYSNYNNFTNKTISYVENWKGYEEQINNAYNLDDSNLDITFNYPCYKIDFKISTTWLTTWGSAEIGIDETYNDNETWDDVKSIFSESGIKGINQTKSTNKISHTDKIAKKIAIKKEGGNSSGKYVHDIKLYIAPHILFSSATTFNFEETKIGECKSYHTIEFHSFLSEGELIIEKPTNFTIISINGQTPIESNGGYKIATNNTLKRIDATEENQKYSIVIGFQPTKEGNITETINIKDTKNTKNTKPITLIGKGFNKQPQIITWNQSLTALEVGTTITLDAIASSGLPITYTSSNPSVASVSGNQLTAHTNGTAIITATATANDIYAETSLDKHTKVGNGNISNCSGNITLKTHGGGSSGTYTLDNLPPIKGKIVKFDYTIAKKKSGLFASNTSYSVSISNDRDNNTQNFSKENSNKNNTITGNETYTFDKEGITTFYVKMESNRDDSKISNIRIELPTTLYTDITSTISFPQTTVNESTSKPLKISFAQLKDNIDISIIGADAIDFSTNKSLIKAGCGNYGIETISITFNPKSYKDTYNATLIIKSEGQSDIKIDLTGSSTIRETTFNKSGDWNNNANWTAGIPTGIGKNAIIAAAVTIPDGYTAIANNITITDGGSITIAPQGKLKINNILNANAQNLILKANENGSAIFLFKNTDKVNATVELHPIASSDGLRNGQPGNFKDPKWQYLGIVAEHINYTTLNTNGTSNWIYRWDETQNSKSCWAEKLNSTSTLYAWIGYCLAQEKDTTYIYPASLINTNHTYTLTYTETENSTDDLGNNLITNSYTAPIDITTLNETNFYNTKANIYIYNTGSWLQWKSTTNTEGFAPGQVINIPIFTISELDNNYPRTIASAQAFFLKATTEDASFTINYEDNVYNTERKENQKRIKRNNESAIFNTLKIQITSSTSNDRLYLLEHENTTENFDNGYDAEKIFDNPNGPQIYATTPFGYTSINTSNSFDGQTIGFIANSEDEIYTITFDTQKLHSYTELYLYDSETETYIDILAGETYQFYASKTPNHNRFKITSTRHDSPQGPTTKIENQYTWEEILQEKQPIYIYTITGQLIGIHKDKTTTPLLPNNTYIIRCGNKYMKFTTNKN